MKGTMKSHSFIPTRFSNAFLVFVLSTLMGCCRAAKVDCLSDTNGNFEPGHKLWVQGDDASAWKWNVDDFSTISTTTEGNNRNGLPNDYSATLERTDTDAILRELQLVENVTTELPTLSPTKLQRELIPTELPTRDINPLETTKPSPMPTGRIPTATPTKRPTGMPSPAPVAGTNAPTPPPTMLPTARPTAQITGNPTKGPTDFPTLEPTTGPTSLPVQEPSGWPTFLPTQLSTAWPTMSPTRRPTVGPTPGPTNPPTPRPTNRPTSSPTDVPSDIPSDWPTTQPTNLSSSHPTANPTSLPTLAQLDTPSPLPPTADPTKAPVDGVDGREDTSSPTPAPTTNDSGLPLAYATVEFSILVENGVRDNILLEDYSIHLVVAVDEIASEQIQRLNSGRRHLEQTTTIWGRRRIQEVKLYGASSIKRVQNVGFTDTPDLDDEGVFQGTECPDTTGSPSVDRCERVYVSLVLRVEGEDNILQIQEDFQKGLDDSVRAGDLEEYLKVSFPTSPVSVLSGQSVEDFLAGDDLIVNPIIGQPSSDSDIFSTEVIAAVAGGILFVLALFVLVVFRPSRRKDEPEEMSNSVVEKELSDHGTIPANGLEWGDIEYLHPLEDIDSVEAGPPSTLNPTSQSVPSGEQYSYYSEYDRDEQSISNGSKESSAVWSSSIGTMETEFSYPVASVVDIGNDETSLPATKAVQASLDDLEAAIAAGDWQALGATAQKLSEQADTASDFGGSESKASSWGDSSGILSARSKAWEDVIDSYKAAELDRYIQQGNWGAIVEAAARYEKSTTESRFDRAENDTKSSDEGVWQEVIDAVKETNKLVQGQSASRGTRPKSRGVNKEELC